MVVLTRFKDVIKLYIYDAVALAIAFKYANGIYLCTTPFCVTRRPIDKTAPANLHIGGASVACSGITINLSA